ncbi:MAG: hypothetical protein MdMp014T_2239 [Treponematales bacterium]
MRTDKKRRLWAALLFAAAVWAGPETGAQEAAEGGGADGEQVEAPGQDEGRENEEDGERETGGEADGKWQAPAPFRYQRGDSMFIISGGITLPAAFSGEITDKGHNLEPVGGTGSLAFNFFVSPHIYWGVELGGMFEGTKGGNMLYIVPFGARLGCQFVLGRFEFPLNVMVGAAPQTYLEKNYFGFFIKPGASAFWRLNTSWSFGLNAAWWWVPQWPENGKNVDGNFMEITLAARYHF